LQSSQFAEVELKVSRPVARVSEKVEGDSPTVVSGNHAAHLAVVSLLRAKGSVVQPTPFAERQDEGAAHHFRSR